MHVKPWQTVAGWSGSTFTYRAWPATVIPGSGSHPRARRMQAPHLARMGAGSSAVPPKHSRVHVVADASAPSRRQAAASGPSLKGPPPLLPGKPCQHGQRTADATALTNHERAACCAPRTRHLPAPIALPQGTSPDAGHRSTARPCRLSRQHPPPLLPPPSRLQLQLPLSFPYESRRPDGDADRGRCQGRRGSAQGWGSQGTQWAKGDCKDYDDGMGRL